MDRLFRNAIIINVVFLGVFILLDAVTWNIAALNLDSNVGTIFRDNGIVTGSHASYTVVQVGITAQWILNGWFGIHYNTGSSINLSLIWFIVTIAVNLFLIWHSETRRVSEQTKGSKTETMSPATEDKLEVQK